MMSDLSDTLLALSDPAAQRRWLAAHGVSLPARMPGLWFSHTYLTLEAALSGQGVAIASEAMLADRVERGLLEVLCPEQAVPGPYGYSLLCLPGAQSRPALKAFCTWLLEEAGVGEPSENGA